MVYRISIALVIVLVVLAGVLPDPFNDVVQEVVRHLVRDAGWTYLVIVFTTLVFLLYLAFGRFGRLRIGGRLGKDRMVNQPSHARSSVPRTRHGSFAPFRSRDSQGR